MSSIHWDYFAPSSIVKLSPSNCGTHEEDQTMQAPASSFDQIFELLCEICAAFALSA